ncbi:aminoacyl-histidine dipeptidase [Ancylomarina sp. 16SWW S1-10-2]|uniref:aminoacyl-histidine dipeptidase n=1 Tax=Ancylomarina sp. 16SWW S1-10-2 TaxID=2499681 RepID=UPI0012ADC501|nr:aminoacyl-histidine dipeptidase [Ancylomarina sp. 16SWW S1-10-2]MRT93735.1 aminoacyl-histidine dipeptidase [Ancylomarina sp. 16SWW S1-10-2]
MSKEILSLEPKAVWANFYSLTQVPRPSKHEDKIQAFMVKFGKDLGLETIKDEAGNVIIKKPATKGMEDRMGVIMQGHLDMVPQKNSDTDHDFEKDPIETFVDGEWLTANGTTLGADNGMGVAAAMTVLQSTDIAHGPIEALFTSDEETGMFGAFGLKAGVLDGDILLNMDSEDEGELYVGCAGGIDANITFKNKTTDTPKDTVAFKLSMKGLKGGHSGMEIILGRGNSNKLLFRFLKHAAKNFGLRLASVDGGSLRNAIPRESFAVVVVPKENVDACAASLKEFEATFKAELSEVEPDLVFGAEPCNLPKKVMKGKLQNRLIDAIYACPNGVIRMSNAMPGMVETSINLARVYSDENGILIQALLRSSVNSAKDDLAEMVTSVFTLAGAKVVLEGQYPGWKPNMDSPILKTMQGVYNKMYGKIPKVMAIHAGLECGLLGSNYPHWDMISFGPTIRFPHSPDEKVKIDTVTKFWDFTVETLKNIPVKK